MFYQKIVYRKNIVCKKSALRCNSNIACYLFWIRLRLETKHGDGIMQYSNLGFSSHIMNSKVCLDAHFFVCRQLLNGICTCLLCGVISLYLLVQRVSVHIKCSNFVMLVHGSQFTYYVKNVFFLFTTVRHISRGFPRKYGLRQLQSPGGISF